LGAISSRYRSRLPRIPPVSPTHLNRYIQEFAANGLPSGARS